MAPTSRPGSTDSLLIIGLFFDTLPETMKMHLNATNKI
jgi:hypothetical protein